LELLDFITPETRPQLRRDYRLLFIPLNR
jgi:hypothetical protein